MSAERASLYATMAARILAKRPHISDGERAVAYASLAQAEAVIGLGALLERVHFKQGSGTEFTETEEVLGSATVKRLHEMALMFVGETD